jgi:ADP-heptose:LPS heptosyltransferase
MRKFLPFATIDYFTVVPEMLKNNMDIDNVYQLQQIQEYKDRYHTILNWDGVYEKTPDQSAFKSFYEGAGLVWDEDDVEDMVIRFTDDEIKIATKIISEHRSRFGDKPISAFFTGKTAWAGRNLECMKFYFSAQYLIDKGWSIIEVGAKDTEPLGVEATSSYDVSPRINAAIISMCQLYVGIDSFPWNAAQATKVPSVVTFGCIDPKTRVLDWSKNVPITSKNLKCLGCHHMYKGPIAQSMCMRETGTKVAPCMVDIQAEQIIEGIDKFV